jgi:hypothetical protein
MFLSWALNGLAEELEPPSYRDAPAPVAPADGDDDGAAS